MKFVPSKIGQNRADFQVTFLQTQNLVAEGIGVWADDEFPKITASYVYPKFIL